ncbi:MAG TPA: PAS domain S-box protein [Candidatus Omnitrophota bacterium]|nr:PAS domain S-box protein [Candidatus Omnitrophota bacterium]HPT38937.1 PAS domain S-box protein [Candidatus Omnitrophota bacterium]
MEDSKNENFEITLAKLRKVEFQQKAILDNIPDIAWLKDLQGRFIAVNGPFVKACGFKVEEIIGKTDLDIWPKELALSYQADDQEVIKSKKRKCVQERLMYQETGEQWIETIKTPFFDDHGNVIGTTGIARNITLYKSQTDRLEDVRAELELRVKVRTAELASSNEALRKEMRLAQETQKELGKLTAFSTNVFNSIQDGLSVLDPEMNVVWCNLTKEKWHEHNLPLVGKKCYAAFHGKNEPCQNCPVKETFKTLKPAVNVSPKHDKEGKIVGYFDLYSFPMFDEKTKKISGVIEYVRDITQRKTAEEALRYSEEKFKTIFENSNIGMLIVDIQTRDFVLSNKAVQKMLGYSKDELSHLGVRDIHAKKDWSFAAEQFERLIKGELINVINIPVKRKDNSIFFANITASMLTLDGRLSVLGSFEDISLQKENSEKLTIAEERYRLVTEQTGQLIYDLNLSTQEIIWSGLIEKITGFTHEEFSKVDLRRWEEMIHPDDRKMASDLLNQTIKSGGVYEVEYRFLQKNGSYAYMKDRGMFLKDKNGKPFRMLGCMEDVSKRKEYENELKVYHEKLEILVEQRTKSLELEIASRKEIEEKANLVHQRLEYTLGVTKTGLDIIDQEYNVIYIDPAWSSVYGEWKGKKCFEYFMGRKERCPTCAIEEALRTKKIVVSEEILEKEGNRPIQITSIPYQGKDGKWYVAEVNVDITQKKKIDEELKRYRNDLEELVGERTRDLLQETNRYKAAELEKSKLNRELIKINEKLKSISLIDAHTGLYNYRYLQEAIEVEFHQARRYAQNLAIIMLDVDYFKSINDVYGIAFGDLVLKQLAKQLKRMVRRYDVLVRYSGEEFIVISPRLSRNVAFNMAQRLLDSLNFINFGNRKHSVKLKISLSVVSFPEDRAKNGMDLVNLADMLLNKVKEGGGNRVYSSLDVKNPIKKGIEKITKSVGIKSLKNTIDKLNKQSKQGLSESIFAFAKTLELKDHYTGEHVENTVHFAVGIAKELNLPKEDVELIKQASMLHDLGKIGISENILLKKGKLNKKEFEEIKKHPQIGADIIRPIQFLHDLIPFIFYHHERWDGKGYPSGIRGEDIPLGARVIAIADVYQALISDRPYHKAFTKTAAIDIIKKSSGTQFDPRIVSAFLRVVGKIK